MEFVDLFSGAGGLSLGLRQAGLKQCLAVDNDADSIRTYRRNIRRAEVLEADISKIEAADILSRVRDRRNLVLAGCPPCQLFSRLHRKGPGSDHIIFHYLELIEEIRARFIVFENVPQITRYGRVWPRVLDTLRRSRYKVWVDTVSVQELGVPQTRKRLVLIASLDLRLEPKVHRRGIRTVRDTIADLPYSCDDLPNHNSMVLSVENLARIQRTPVDGGKSRTSRGFSDSYARMFWDRPAPTITTKCVSFSNGRFGHPEFDRAITVREAARLQSFRDDFVFEGGLLSTARQVGNAVPPVLGRWMGRQILRSL